MSSSEIFLVRDDNFGHGLVSAGQWAFTLGDYNFGGDTIYSVINASNTGAVNVSFQGTSIAFFGNSPPSWASQQFQVTIDNNKPYNTSTSDTDPQHYMQWYQSPLLPSETHSISVSDMDGLALDYMVITPGPDTPLTGHTLMIDDFYQGIKYSGKWQNLTSQTFDGSSTILGGYAFQNSTHTTSNVGDSLSFSYTGTNLSVYGIYPFEQIGSISLSYTVDGGTPSTNNFTSQGPGATSINEQPHFKLLETGPLSPGNHTLNMTLASCNGQTLIIDYLLYSPSFNSLSVMPNYTPPPSSTSNPSLSSSSSSQDRSTPVGAIAGGAGAGAVVLLVILAALFLWRRRRNKETQEEAEPSSLTDSLPSRSGDIVIEEVLSPLSEKRSASSFGYTGSIGSVSSPNASSSTCSPSLHTHTQNVHGHLDAISELHNAASPTSDATVPNRNVDTLMRRIQDLTEENERLAMMAAAPPAYE